MTKEQKFYKALQDVFKFYFDATPANYMKQYYEMRCTS